MKTEYTATAVILNPTHPGCLLLWHEKLRSYLPPGGHIEEGETPQDAVIREVKEETGMDIALISAHQQPAFQEKEAPRVHIHPQPYTILIHNVPFVKEEKRYVDFVFLAKVLPKGNQVPMEGWWYTPDAIADLPKSKIFPQVQHYLDLMMRDVFPRPTIELLENHIAREMKRNKLLSKTKHGK